MTVTIAVVQMSMSEAREDNVARAVDLSRQAAARGANIVLLPELFEGPYFPQHERPDEFARAQALAEHPTLATMAQLAGQLGVVIPVSIFECDGPHYYNSVVVIDADGHQLGVYRKSHIPDGPGYEEKYYFRPGNTGFRAWSTKFGTIGVGVCWDQWFPEAARAMALAGADVLLYPTAIGSEPEEPELDTSKPWQRVMAGHAVANVCAVAAANRVGREHDMTFYGHSFVCDHRGEPIAALGDSEAGVALATIDLGELRKQRASFGFFRDRRPDLYGPLTST